MRRIKKPGSLNPYPATIHIPIQALRMSSRDDRAFSQTKGRMSTHWTQFTAPCPPMRRKASPPAKPDLSSPIICCQPGC